MSQPRVSFKHGSQRLPNGKFLGTVDFIRENGLRIVKPISYPEQFDTAVEAAAHAFREATRGRACPF